LSKSRSSQVNWKDYRRTAILSIHPQTVKH
jgi:hypothetical protein